MKIRGIYKALLIFVTVTAAIGVWSKEHHRKAEAASEATVAAVPVSAAAVRIKDVPSFLEAPGTVTAVRTVTITTQVSGTLDTVSFQEGQMVKKGQILARIDSRALEAQLMQATGLLDRDSALLANARVDLERDRQLIKVGSITQQALDTQLATVHADAGTVDADRGSVKNLQVQIGYCTIVAPIDGVVGLRLVDPGNYVTAGSTTGIAVLTQLEPAMVTFSMPEDDLGSVHRALSNGAVPVLAYDRDKKTLLASGALLALDNQVDATTGTVKLKAEFSHAGDALFPNQFVNVRMQVDTLRGVPVVPTVAIQHGTQGDFVFVVGRDGKAVMLNVKVGAVSGDDTAIVDATVHAGEQVVTEGADRLDRGTPLHVVAN
ncbi:efflux RND transporter periplasmic adaptor subunit [Paraburkholderia sp. NMBU_R16]|nr:efflux RND transporter periplasmic adaptor subunit [Paraburkholderia sp. NMBU_R16]